MSIKPLTEIGVTDLWREVKDNGEELVLESSRAERLRFARRAGFEPSVLRRYARRLSEVDRVIVEMFLAGGEHEAR